MFSTGRYSLSPPLYINLKQSWSMPVEVIFSKPSYFPIPWSIWAIKSPISMLLTSLRKFSVFLLHDFFFLLEKPKISRSEIK